MQLGSTLSRLSFGLAVALGVSLAPAAKADPIFFNPTGDGAASTFNVTGLGFGPGNALAVGAITPGVGLVLGQQFTLLFQTHLTSLVGPNAPASVPGLNTTFQITEVASFTETVTSIMTGPNGTTATFALVPNAANRISIFQNNAVVFNDAAGTGFAVGTEIARLNPNNLISSSFTDNTANQGLTQFNRTGAGNGTTFLSTQGSGSTNLSSAVVSVNTAFFQTPMLASSLLNSNLTSVFDSVAPSLLFDSNFAATPTVAPRNGPINGRSGPDFQIQVSGFTQSFTTAAVPEPASVAMTVLGLAGAGLGSVAARRRQAKASA